MAALNGLKNQCTAWKGCATKKENVFMSMMDGEGPNQKKLLQSLGLVALCLITLAGCLVGPDYRPPETKVPENWSGQAVVTPAQPSKTTTDPASLVEWWNAFNDPILSSLVEMAIRSNLDLRQAEARIRQARASRGVAGAALLPAVDASVLYQKSQGSSEAGGGGAIATVGGESGKYFRWVWMQAGKLIFSGASGAAWRPPPRTSGPRWMTAGTFS